MGTISPREAWGPADNDWHSNTKPSHLTSRHYNSVKLFMLQGLQRDQAEARCQLKPHLCVFPYTILAFLTPLQVSSEHIPSVDYLHKIPLPGSGWKLIKDTFVRQTRCLQ